MKPTAGSGAEGKPAKAKRGWLMGCAMAVLIVGCVLALLAAVWSWKVDRDGARFIASVQAMRSQYEAENPRPPDEDNAAALYAELCGLSGPFAFRVPARFSSDELAAYDSTEAWAFLAEQQQAIEAAREAARRPNCYYGTGFLDGGRIPGNLRAARGGAKLLQFAAFHKARSGSLPGAFGDAESIFQIARHSAAPGLSMDISGRIVVEEVAVETWDVLMNETTPQAATIDSGLRSFGSYLDQRTKLCDALDTDKLYFLSLVASAQAGKLPPGQVVWGVFASQKTADRLQYEFWRRSGLMLADVRLLVVRCDQLAAAMRLPCPEALVAVGEIDKMRALPRWALMSRVGSFERLPQLLHDCGSLAQLHAARLGLGCRLYRLKFGAYPESLAELSAKLPEHFKELPADPFTGQPFLYKRTAAGCMIWSVGKDRVDDGGDTQKDIIFELKR